MRKRSLIVLLIGVFFLSAFGLVMLMSTCVFSAQADEADIYRDAKRQGIWLVIAIMAACFTALVDYRVWRKMVWFMVVGACVLLLACYLPATGVLVNGERRWIELGPIQLQPSEFAKIAVVFFIAYWYHQFPNAHETFLQGFLYPMALVGLMIGLVLFEVDIGSTAVISITVLLLLFIACVHWKYIAGLLFAGVLGFAGMMLYAPNRIERLVAFLDPEKHRYDAGFQQWVSLMALGSGGVTGRGLGEGRLKMLYMPFAHTDFIFPMIGEELGLIGSMAVLLGFVFIVTAGMFIAFNAPDRFGMLVGSGICCLITIQAFFNMAVTTALLPNTGLPLPFISYGGSALVMCFASIGILINIYRQGRRRPLTEDSEWEVESHRDLIRV